MISSKKEEFIQKAKEVFKKYMPEPETQESYLDVIERESQAGKKKRRYR